MLDQAQSTTLHYMWHFMLHDKWAMPNLQDSVEFMVTESVEAMQERLRLPNTHAYHRTNPRESNTKKVAVEVWDTVFMANITMAILEEDLLSIGFDKLDYKCQKFGIPKLTPARTRAECALAGLEPYQITFEEFSNVYPYAEVQRMLEDMPDVPESMKDLVVRLMNTDAYYADYIRRTLSNYGDHHAAMYGIPQPKTITSFAAYAIIMKGAMLSECWINADIIRRFESLLDERTASNNWL